MMALQMYICEFCLKFFAAKCEHVWHLQKCKARVRAGSGRVHHRALLCGSLRIGVIAEWQHPPGDEIYRKDGVAVFEVDGAVEKFYCQVS